MGNSTKINRRRDAWNSGNKDGSRTVQKEDSKALVTVDGDGVDWSNHSKNEDYTLMACNSSDSVTYVISCSTKCKESYANLKKLYDAQREQLNDASIEIKAYSQGLKKVKAYAEPSELVSEPVVNESNVECQPMFLLVLLGEKGKLLLSPQQVVIGDNKDITGTISPTTMVDPILEIDYPHRALKNKGIVDSGCSRHMTGNKAYLAEFQDFNGGPVAFGGSKGYITGKGKIKTGKLDFEDVCFVKELQHFNLFSVSQMCDKKNKVLFTDSECLVLSPEFKLPDENQMRGASSRKDHMKHNPHPPLLPLVKYPHRATELTHISCSTSEVTLEQQLTYPQHPSRPLHNTPDSIPETSGGNLGGHSPSDKSLSGNEGDMTIQSVYDLCLSLCARVSDQAEEIQDLKAQITKLKKQAKPVIKYHKAWLKSVSLNHRLTRKSFPKKQRVHKESVSKQGRNFAKGEPSVQRDPLFDELPEDTVDHTETENAQDEGRTRDIVDEDKEIEKNVLSTEDALSTDKDKVSTDKEKLSTDRPIVSTDGSKVSTDMQVFGAEEIFEGTEEQREGTEEKVKSTDGQVKGTEDQTEEEIATQATQTSTQTPTSMIFGDDETIAKVLLNMSQAKAVSKEKEKGVELKDVEETDRPRPTSTRSLLTLKPLPKIDPKDKGKKKIEEEDESESESDGIPQAEKKFKQLESDEELARKVQEEWEAEEERNRIAEENAANEDLIRDFDDIKARIEADRLLAEKLQEQEREQFTIEERAKFLHDTIAAQRKFLAQQRSEAIRNKPPTKNQLRNQMMTYLKHVGNYKHAELKIKKFEEVQALYEKIKRSDEDFISIGSAEDERLIKRMNEKGVDLSKSAVIKKENKEEVKEENKDVESTRKRKLGTRKKMKSRKRRYIQNTSEDDSDKENDELRLHLTIVPDEEKEVDYEILDRKYPIKEWKTECFGTKPQSDQTEHLEEINLNVVIRSNGQKRHFSTLMSVLSIFDREDLDAMNQLVMDRFHDEMPEGFDRVLWGDLMVLFNSDDKDEFWASQQDWKIESWKLHSSSGVHTLVTDTGLVIHMLVEKKYPLRKEVLEQMLKLKLESEEENTMALELIKFVKKILAELEPKE
ncbi:hypothetical protein Tco_1051061 [Tanacetum coccineum]